MTTEQVTEQVKVTVLPYMGPCKREVEARKNNHNYASRSIPAPILGMERLNGGRTIPAYIAKDRDDYGL